VLFKRLVNDDAELYCSLNANKLLFELSVVDEEMLGDSMNGELSLLFIAA
jgi:hypothetical protein